MSEMNNMVNSVSANLLSPFCFVFPMNGLKALTKIVEMQMLALSLTALTHEKCWYIVNEIIIAPPIRNKNVQADFTLECRTQSS